MTIQWYPGQMTKARRNIQSKLKLVDVIVEVRDARIPTSSENPDLANIVGEKKKIILLNKADLVSEIELKKWCSYLENSSQAAFPINSQKGSGIKNVLSQLEEIKQEKEARKKRKGSVRLIVVGIPNVGKSTLINRLADKKVAKTGDRPGVTVGEQWIRVKKGIEILDTPGLLWPKFEDEEVAFKLAAVGTIKSQILDEEAIAARLVPIMLEKSPQIITERYELSETIDEPTEVLLKIGHNRGYLISGGEIDLYKASMALLSDFRKGLLGKIILDKIPASI